MKNKEPMERSKLDDYKVGDHLILTGRSKRGEEQRAAIVTMVDYNELGLVTYTGRNDEKGMLPSGSGAFDPDEVGTKAFGFYVRVEKTGRNTNPFPKSWQPKPGDRGYDLMC